MSGPQTLTLGDVTSLFTLRGAYTLAYSFTFGMAVWVSFFGGVIAYKTLPRQMFGNLQHRTFPIYFNVMLGLSTGLLGAWTYKHPDVISYATKPLVPDVFQAYALGSVILTCVANSFVLGPMTSKTMFKRHKLEKEEGKAYNDPGVSDEMKALNRYFMQLHGYSSLANLGALIALAIHGLWYGSHGL
ncbi:unnamed protein product [Peniophora sp. CBMAI 1063]|nr:unnamed protein product [Peniophora sp. CBMAI 1063]